MIPASQRLPQEDQQVNPSWEFGQPQDHSSLDNRKPSGGNQSITLRKCSCHSSWCPLCFYTFTRKNISKKLQRLNWRKLRHISLTVSREKFRDGEEAFKEISEKRGIGNLLKNFSRTDGIVIEDWVSVLEWHRDGYPHWHLFIQVEKEGPAGMIGHRIISGRWQFGIVVNESYIKNESHWGETIGYFNKRGYFEKGKGHQGVLPEWAKRSEKRIKRYESMNQEKGSVRMSQDKTSFIGEGDSIGEKSQRRESYEVILARCGEKSKLIYKRDGIIQEREVPVRYEILKQLSGWEWREGKGLVMEIPISQMQGFEEMISVLMHTPPPTTEKKREVAENGVSHLLTG